MKIIINMDKACAECGKGGATESGLCLKCANKAMGSAPMKSAAGRAMQRRWRTILDGHRMRRKR